MKVYFNFRLAIRAGWEYIISTGREVKQQNWQGKKAPKPMLEALDFEFKCPMPNELESAKSMIKPNLPWVDEHFEERVSGIPVNPPKSHNNWPFGQKNNKEFQKDGKFDHTYPERFWPRYVRGVQPSDIMRGIRFDYGDLADVITKLETDPFTRQAYLPIWFPEDTGKPNNIRVPCSLGYHFMVREGRLDIKYIMRSTDMLRHFQDDIYMAYRLALYVFIKLRENNNIPVYNLGYMTFLTFSAHVFSDEGKLLERKIKEWNQP